MTTNLDGPTGQVLAIEKLDPFAIFLGGMAEGYEKEKTGDCSAVFCNMVCDHDKISAIAISSAAAAAIAVRFLLGKHGESGFIGFRFLA